MVTALAVRQSSWEIWENERAEQERRKNKQEESLLLWADKHGSCFLKRRIEGKYKWIGLAVQEWATKVIGSESYGSWRVEESNDRPNETEIDAKDLLQSLADRDGLDCTADLVKCGMDRNSYVRVKFAFHEDYLGQSFARYYLVWHIRRKETIKDFVCPC